MKISRIEALHIEGKVMTLRNFINRLAYYSYKEDRSNYVLHCIRPNECEDGDDCVEIRGDYIRRALATRFEVEHPQYPSLHIPYENVKEIVNLRTGRRIIFRHIPKEAQIASFTPSAMKIVEEL